MQFSIKQKCFSQSIFLFLLLTLETVFGNSASTKIVKFGTFMGEEIKFSTFLAEKILKFVTFCGTFFLPLAEIYRPFFP